MNVDPFDDEHPHTLTAWPSPSYGDQTQWFGRQDTTDAWMDCDACGFRHGAGQYDCPNSFTTEVRVVNETTGGAKGRKLARHELLPPEALTAIAERFGLGAAKYEDRNWERGYDWSLSYGALQRHLLAWWGGEDLDTEFGDSHLAAAGFHVLVLLSFIENYVDGDDRPTTKHTPQAEEPEIEYD